MKFGIMIAGQQYNTTVKEVITWYEYYKSHMVLKVALVEL